MIVSGKQEGTQPFIYMYPFSPKLPSHPGCHITLTEFSELYSRSLLVIHFKYSSVDTNFCKMLQKCIVYFL